MRSIHHLASPLEAECIRTQLFFGREEGVIFYTPLHTCIQLDLSMSLLYAPPPPPPSSLHYQGRAIVTERVQKWTKTPIN